MISKYKTSYKLSSLIFSSFRKKHKATFLMLAYNQNMNELRNIFNADKFLFIAKTMPEVYYKPFRQYVSSTMKKSEKFQHISSHYRFLSENFNDLFIEQVYVKRHLELLSINIQDLENLKIILGYNALCGKEGELSLQLLNDRDEKLYAITFSFQKKYDDLHLVIGGIQGGKGSNEVIKELTKKMHGLRPRNLLVFIMRAIAIATNAKQILAISEENHMEKQKKRKNFCAPYNTYWEEESGIKHNGWYNIPIYLERKTIEEIATKKRSMYKKRYVMMDEFSVEIENNFSSFLKKNSQ